MPNTDTRYGRRERLRVSIRSQVRSFFRMPANVVLLFFLPVVVIEGYGVAMDAFPQLGFMDVTEMAEMGRVNGAIYGAAFITAILGLLQVISAIQADERLRVCGYTRAELFASRLVTVVAGAFLVSGVSIAVLGQGVNVEAPLAAFAALTLAALLYGLIGMLVGAVVPRALEGSLILVFLIDFDDFLSSGMLDIDSWLLNFFPLHYPHSLFRSAVFDGTVDAAEAIAATEYFLIVLVVVTVLYVVVTDEGDGGLFA